MAVVITGGNGFVGKHLVNELKQEWPGAKLVVWDLPEVDITQPETYQDELARLKPDWLVHLAAIAPVPMAAKDPDLTHRVNVEATRKLLVNVRSASLGTKVLAISSADIYGFASEDPLAEQPLAVAKPKNPYAQSKWEMEKMIEEKFNDFVLRVRPFPHIGPGQGKGFVTADFASQIAVLEAGNTTPVRGGLRVGDLSTRRDFTDVRDVVRAYRLLMEKGAIGEVYHVASGRAVAIKEILNKLLALAEVKAEVKQADEHMRPSDIPVAVGDAGKLRQQTGWQPAISLDQSLTDVLAWWRQSYQGKR